MGAKLGMDAVCLVRYLASIFGRRIRRQDACGGSTNMDRGTDEMAVAQWGVELRTQTRLLVAWYRSSRRLAKKKANKRRPRAVWSERSWFGLYGSGWVSQYSVGSSREVCDGGQWQCGSDTCHGVGFAGKSQWWIR
ncbi:hypothetical protein FH972_007281 [Carpinus fangiana]|uniref:Uncharacterized protein n=1 Tax=Carpinus fangiana TaxID=176857 RepID=A0A5N6QUX3_9ROSI|nr:hypothetical protein FH972_007281 [Carpinus fangiana]